jgi:phosphatidylinositol glycan class K
MTGHGGNEFLKFQDAEEIGAFDIADAFEQMWEKRRYNEILFMIDTCQANTMYSKFYSPNILAVGSSAVEENSYSHHADQDVGVAVIDRFTYYNLEFLESIDKTSKKTMADLFGSYDPEDIHSNPGIRSDLFTDPLDQVLITDFFGNVQNVEIDNVEDDVLLLSKLAKQSDEHEHEQPVTVAIPDIINDTVNNRGRGRGRRVEDSPIQSLVQQAERSCLNYTASLTVVGAIALAVIGSSYI